MELHELITALEKLPSLIASAEQAVADKQTEFQLTLNAYGKAVAKEKTIQYAKMRMKEMTNKEAEGWVDFNTLDGQLVVIGKQSELGKAKVELNRLANKFISARKIASLKETELKSIKS